MYFYFFFVSSMVASNITTTSFWLKYYNIYITPFTWSLTLTYPLEKMMLGTECLCIFLSFCVEFCPWMWWDFRWGILQVIQFSWAKEGGTMLDKLSVVRRKQGLFCHEKTQRKGNHLQISLFTRTRLCWYYDLRLLAYRTPRNQYLLFKPSQSVNVILWWQPKKIKANDISPSFYFYFSISYF